MPAKKDASDYVYLDHTAFRSRDEAYEAYDSPPVPIRDWWSWSIWRVRAVGWGISDGSTIYHIASWKAEGRTHHQVMARVTAREVGHWENLTWGQATSELAGWTGEPLSVIRANDYTRSKKALPGPWRVLAYQAGSAVRVDFELPRDVVIGRNGWARVAVSTAAGWPDAGPAKRRPPRSEQKPAGGAGGGRGGQGRLDKAARDVVEVRAMEAARAWCRGQGWRHVKDVSKKEPWDLEAIDASGATRFVEVKGTTGRAMKFDVTAGEVAAARRHKRAHALVAVTGIRLSLAGDGGIIATGGVVRAFDPWMPKQDELVETRYMWERPSPSR